MRVLIAVLGVVLFSGAAQAQPATIDVTFSEITEVEVHLPRSDPEFEFWVTLVGVINAGAVLPPGVDQDRILIRADLGPSTQNEDTFRTFVNRCTGMAQKVAARKDKWDLRISGPLVTSFSTAGINLDDFDPGIGFDERPRCILIAQ